MSPQLGTPIGSVTFKDGTTTLGVGALVGGQATFNTSSLASAPERWGAFDHRGILWPHSNIVCPPDTVFYGSTSSTIVRTKRSRRSALTVTADVKSKTYDGGRYSPFTATLDKLRFPGSQTNGGLRGSGDLSGYAGIHRGSDNSRQRRQLPDLADRGQRSRRPTIMTSRCSSTGR